MTNSVSLYQPGDQQRSRAWLRPPNDATWLRITRICVECGWVSTVWDIYPRSPSILGKTVTPCRVISYHGCNQVSCNIIIILYNPYLFLSQDRQPRYVRLQPLLLREKSEWHLTFIGESHSVPTQYFTANGECPSFRHSEWWVETYWPYNMMLCFYRLTKNSQVRSREVRACLTSRLGSLFL